MPNLKDVSAANLLLQMFTGAGWALGHERMAVLDELGRRIDHELTEEEKKALEAQPGLPEDRK